MFVCLLVISLGQKMTIYGEDKIPVGMGVESGIAPKICTFPTQAESSFAFHTDLQH